MKNKTLSKNKVRGVSAKIIAVPILLVVIILHISIIFNVIDINSSNSNLYALMQRSGAYQIDATSMQASNTVLSETSSNYIQMPIDNDSNANVGPLMTYVRELDSDRRSPKVAARFRDYDVSYDVLLCIEKASLYSEQIMNIQMHAIAVMSSVYPLPDIPELEVFSDIELTQAELAMSNDERVAYARNMVVESSYAQLRYKVAENVDNCNNLLQQEFAEATEKSEQHVNMLRNVLWIEFSIIILVLGGAFVQLYFFVLRPLRIYSKNIAENKSIDYNSGVYEMNNLVNAFNGLWDYRNKIETILRTEAENDALTGLPNRYCLEHDIIKNNDEDKSLAVLMFDVNFLKKTNDTKGHLAGDNLIRTAASCIKECFCVDKKSTCYRVGGDEFIVLLFDVAKDEIKRRVDKFNLALIREDISVSYGYAYSDKNGEHDFKKLMEEADKKMYKQKKIIHDIKK